MKSKTVPTYIVKRDLVPSGLGDKLTELWFYATCAKIVNPDSHVLIRSTVNNTEPDRIYDLNRMNVNGIEIVPSNFISSPDTDEIDNLHMNRYISTLISPETLCKLIKNKKDMGYMHPEIQGKCKGFDFQRMFFQTVQKDGLTKEIVTKIYKSVCMSTKFDTGEANVPEFLEEYIGIHIRVGDKVNLHSISVNNPDFNIKYTLNDFKKMQENAFMYAQQQLRNGNKKFYLCSDDKLATSFFSEKLKELGTTDVYTNISTGNVTLDCMLDMMCLSKCKIVCQLTKVSTFSLAAALIGDKPLHNFYDGPNPYLDVWDDTVNIV